MAPGRVGRVGQRQYLRGRAAQHHPAAARRRHLGHVDVLQGIDPEEIITAVRTRRAPTKSAAAGLRL
jgi:hypothetical protein